MGGSWASGGRVLKALAVGALLLALLVQTCNYYRFAENPLVSSLYRSRHSAAHPPSTTSQDTMAAKVGADALIQLAKNRRSYYPLSKDLPISTARIQELVKETTLETPSSFNSQSNRLVVLLGAEHEKLWDIARDILKTIVAEDAWKATGDKLALFRGAAGTVLFFDDQDVVNSFQAKFPPYADKFPIWAHQSNAIQQYLLWTGLEAEGLGANLQHYNPLLDQKVAETWGLPASWKLNAQLVFGGRTGETYPKDYQPVEDRVKFFGA